MSFCSGAVREEGYWRCWVLATADMGTFVSWWEALPLHWGVSPCWGSLLWGGLGSRRTHTASMGPWHPDNPLLSLVASASQVQLVVSGPDLGVFGFMFPSFGCVS